MICKNCEHSFSGKFCGNCGQKSGVGRINFEYLINEIPDSIFQLNHGIFYTIKELFIRPGHAIRGFLSGRRIHHYKPIAFLLVTTTIYVLVAYWLSNATFLDDFITGIKDGQNDANQTLVDVGKLNWILKYQVYVPLLILPIFSISTYIAFLKSAYNYFEHLVINIYITGQQMLIYLLLGSLSLHENLIFLIGVVYNFLVFIQLFENKKLVKKIALIILSYLIFAIILVVIAFLLFRLPKF